MVDACEVVVVVVEEVVGETVVLDVVGTVLEELGTVVEELETPVEDVVEATVVLDVVERELVVVDDKTEDELETTGDDMYI